MSYFTELRKAELVALGWLTGCAATFSLFSSYIAPVPSTLVQILSPFFIFCALGVLPVSLYGAPVCALLRSRGLANWWSALLTGLLPGLIGIFPGLGAYSRDSFLLVFAVFALITGGVIALLTHFVIAGHASRACSFFKSKPLYGIAWIAGFILLGIGADRYHQEKLREQAISNAALAVKSNIENVRLRNIVEAEIEKIPLPAGSSLIYQEIEASRICKTSKIKRLYVNESSPLALCNTVDIILQEAGWETRDRCYDMTSKQNTRASSGSDGFRYVARRPLGKFVLEVLAKPNESWVGPTDISDFAEEKVLPIAKQEGKPYFILSVNYIEDSLLFNQKCPDNGVRCDCVDGSFFARKLEDQSETVSSH